MRANFVVVLRILLTFLLAGAVSTALAAPGDPAEPAASPQYGPELAPAADPPLRVGVVGTPPFLLSRPGEPLGGISADLWREVALELGLAYDFVPLPNTEAAIAQLAEGECDVLIGPISITSERSGRVSFTQPYWDANLAILAKAGGGSIWQRVRPFLSRAFMWGVGVLLVVLGIVGALLWAVERNANDQFPKHAVPGIATGMWLAVVTMTSVGYGDKTPITAGGRVVAGVWMVIAMITSSSLTAGIATALTLTQLEDATISTAKELDGQQVAVIDGSTGEAFARRMHARVIPVDGIEAAAQVVEDGDALAIVFDRPALQYYLASHPRSSLVLSSHAYEPVGYGFAVPLGSPLLNALNVTMLSIRESDRLKRIGDDYL